MNQIRIGKFIAESRKSKNLTQRQLADELSISDKTVSKWECGKGLPKSLSCCRCARHWILPSTICFRVKRSPQLIIKRKRRET